MLKGNRNLKFFLTVIVSYFGVTSLISKKIVKCFFFTRIIYGKVTGKGKTSDFSETLFYYNTHNCITSCQPTPA